MTSKQKTIAQVVGIVVLILILLISLVKALNGPKEDRLEVVDTSESSSQVVSQSSEESLSSYSSISSSESVSESITESSVEESSSQAQLTSEEIESITRKEESLAEDRRVQELVDESNRKQAEAVKQESIRKQQEDEAAWSKEQYAESVRKREIAKHEESTKQEKAKQEAAKQEKAKQEAAKQEAAKQEAAKQEAAKQESIRLESVEQERIKQESIQAEAARQESIKQESIRLESVEQERIKQESIKKEESIAESTRIETERASIEESVAASINESIRINNSIDESIRVSIDESIRLEQSDDETPPEVSAPETGVGEEPAVPQEYGEGHEILIGSLKWLKEYKDGYILFSVVEMGETPELNVKITDTHTGIYEQGIHISGLKEDSYIIGDTHYYDLNKELAVRGIESEELNTTYTDGFGITTHTPEVEGETYQLEYQQGIQGALGQLEGFVRGLDTTRFVLTDAGLTEIELTQEEVTQINTLLLENGLMKEDNILLTLDETYTYYLNVNSGGLIGGRIVDAEGIEVYKLALGSERREWVGIDVASVVTHDYDQFLTAVAPA